MGENEEETLDDFLTGPQSDENIPDGMDDDFNSFMDGKFPESKHSTNNSKMILRAAEKVAEALSQLEGQEFKIHDGSIDGEGFDLDTEKEGMYAGGSYTVHPDGSIVNDALPHRPVYGFVNDSVDDIIETIRKLKLTSDSKSEDAEIDASKSDLDNDGKLSEYEKKRGQAIADAMEKDKKEEEEDDRVSSYLKLQKAKEDMPKIPENKNNDKKEEDEQIALSPQEVARRMQDQRRSELQNYYKQERLNRYGY